MASLPVQGAQSLMRLTTAARLARMRPDSSVRVESVGVLHTERLLIRPMTWADRAAFLGAARASRDVLDRFCPLHQGAEDDDAMFDRQLAVARAAQATGRAWRRVIEDRRDGERGGGTGRIVGAINLNNVLQGFEPRAEVNFWVRSDAAGLGFGAEAMRAVIAHAFGPTWAPRAGGAMHRPGLGLSRIDALIAPANSGCRRVVERLGFAPDPDGPGRTLRIGGTDVEHLAYTAFAPIENAVSPAPPGRNIDSLTRVIDIILGVERIARERGS